MVLRSPYPWFGGKATVADFVWQRFGDVRNFVDPFFGSGAVLLQRPQPFSGTETVNDLDGMVANFWRAMQEAPEEVAQWADWPVNECDLHARHLWLTNEGRQHVERLKDDAAYYDAKIAGWWVWGICQWIGGGWCTHLGDASMGIHRPSQKRPHLGPGRGIHRPKQQIYAYFTALSERLRGVRVCCGDWSRVCGPAPTVTQGLTAVFLDPPYTQTERDSDLYAVETNVAGEARQWCLENGDDKRLRIILCGYEGEGHEVLEEAGWTVWEWKAQGGYSCRNKDNANSHRERLWISPHCIEFKKQSKLFA